MRARVWGARGTLPAPGPETARYGGNTSCVAVEDDAGSLLILDAGSGIRLLGGSLPRSLRRIDLLLTHLHLDHIMGLGFFGPLRWPEVEAHIYAPAGTALDLETRLMRYLAPPYFPIHINELGSQLTLHEVGETQFELNGFQIACAPVCHPGPTVAYRITDKNGKTLAYVPDHEPALGAREFPISPEWTSGFAIAEGADLLFHDAQYTEDEYADRVGWGHSKVDDALKFAKLAGAQHIVTFHHDPNHTDADIDGMLGEAQETAGPGLTVSAAAEGEVYELG